MPQLKNTDWQTCLQTYVSLKNLQPTSFRGDFSMFSNTSLDYTENVHTNDLRKLSKQFDVRKHMFETFGGGITRPPSSSEAQMGASALTK